MPYSCCCSSPLFTLFSPHNSSSNNHATVFIQSSSSSSSYHQSRPIPSTNFSNKQTTTTISHFNFSTNSIVQLRRTTTFRNQRPPPLGSSIISPYFHSCRFQLFPTDILQPKHKPTTTTSSSTLHTLSSLFAKGLVFFCFLIGSFILSGCVRTRPTLAAASPPPPQRQRHNSVNIEEKGESQQSEEEDMLYVKLVEQSPRDVEALKAAFQVKMRRGKTKEAVGYVEKLIDVDPGELEWRLLQALSYEMMGHFTKAKRLFKDILANRPLLLRALHGLAMVMHKNHEGTAVFEMLYKALELARREKRVTEERNIRILIAQMHVVKGELMEGLKQFQDLVNENPRDFRPYLCQGNNLRFRVFVSIKHITFRFRPFIQGIIYSLLDKKNDAEEQFDIYRSLVPDEFPQRGFLNDVVLAAKTSSQQQLEKEFKAAYSPRKPD